MVLISSLTPERAASPMRGVWGSPNWRAAGCGKHSIRFSHAGKGFLMLFISHAPPQPLLPHIGWQRHLPLAPRPELYLLRLAVAAGLETTPHICFSGLCGGKVFQCTFSTSETVTIWGDLNSGITPVPWGVGQQRRSAIRFFLSYSLLMQQRIIGQRDVEKNKIY